MKKEELLNDTGIGKPPMVREMRKAIKKKIRELS